MKLLKIFGGLTAVILILLFLLQNTVETKVNLIFVEYENISVAFIMVGALALGILIGYGAAVLHFLTAKAEIRALKTQNRRISDELNDLRNVAIDEGIYDGEDGDN